MKQIFDWLREQINATIGVELFGTEYTGINRVNRIINEAEAKWEADCCDWSFFKPSNSLYEKHGDFRTGDELEKWSVCPYCGKSIKISEVE